MVKIQKYLIIVEARFKSTRFEGKILKRFKKSDTFRNFIKKIKEFKISNKNNCCLYKRYKR